MEQMAKISSILFFTGDSFIKNKNLDYNKFDLSGILSLLAVLLHWGVTCDLDKF